MKPTLEQLTAEFGDLTAANAATSNVGLPLAGMPLPDGRVTRDGPASDSTGSPQASAGPTVAPPAPPGPVQSATHALKGFDLDVAVAPGQIVAAAELLDRHGFGLDAITGVDWLAQNQMEVVYDYFHPTTSLRVVVRTRVPRTEPELPTISAVFPGANWHERETHDFFGIRFAGHPNLTPFLLPEDANFHPLRKDYIP